SASNLQVGIIGAGIAGLAAGIAMRRAGHDVVIYEKSSFKQEIGAAVSATPNMVRILDRWGFDFKRARAWPTLQIRVPNGTTLELEYQDSFGGLEGEYGHTWLSMHRVDLHKELRSVAENPANHPTKPVAIELGSEVIDINCEEGIIIFNDGSRISKDLVVVADGAHSRHLQLITGKPIPMIDTGRSVYRALVPMNKVLEKPALLQLFENQAPGFVSIQGPSPLVSAFTYPCREGTLLNYVLLHPTKHRDEDKDSTQWNHPATKDDLRECLQGFHPDWTSLCDALEEVKFFRMMHHEPLETMVRGKAVVIGDAAHPMLPVIAQGAASAVEDAAALEAIFTTVSQEQDVRPYLKVFDLLRLPRNATTQVLSNHPMEPRSKIEERLRGYPTRPAIPEVGVLWVRKPWRDFYFTYDVYAEAEKAK
ncbi:FAD/NAD(P)-binding domain-containing protein, partial [Patellaria atrata CBS 101060]